MRARSWRRRGRGRRRRRDAGRARRGYHPTREGQDVVGVGARCGGARVGRAVAPHHRAGAARAAPLARRGRTRRQRTVWSRRYARAPRPAPPAPLAPATRLDAVHTRREISGKILLVLQCQRSTDTRASVHQVAGHAILVAALVERSGRRARLPGASLCDWRLYAKVLQFLS